MSNLPYMKAAVITEEQINKIKDAFEFINKYFQNRPDFKNMLDRAYMKEATEVIQSLTIQDKVDEPVASLLLGGVVNVEYEECEIDPWPNSMEALQERLVHNGTPVSLTLYARAGTNEDMP